MCACCFTPLEQENTTQRGRSCSPELQPPSGPALGLHFSFAQLKRGLSRAGGTPRCSERCFSRLLTCGIWNLFRLQYGAGISQVRSLENLACEATCKEGVWRVPLAMQSSLPLRASRALLPGVSFASRKAFLAATQPVRNTEAMRSGFRALSAGVASGFAPGASPAAQNVQQGRRVISCANSVHASGGGVMHSVRAGTRAYSSHPRVAAPHRLTHHASGLAAHGVTLETLRTRKFTCPDR